MTSFNMSNSKALLYEKGLQEKFVPDNSSPRKIRPQGKSLENSFPWKILPQGKLVPRKWYSDVNINTIDVKLSLHNTSNNDTVWFVDEFSLGTNFVQG
jgi:hypothetical protein